MWAHGEALALASSPALLTSVPLRPEVVHVAALTPAGPLIARAVWAMVLCLQRGLSCLPRTRDPSSWFLVCLVALEWILDTEDALVLLPEDADGSAAGNGPALNAELWSPSRLV